MTRAARVLTTTIAAVLLSTPAPAETIPGPVPASVVRVIDGDTVLVRARPWLGVTVTTSVRLAGNDTPEIGRRAKCVREREFAEAARAKARSILSPGTAVTLRNVRPDKYGGRVVAEINVGGTDVAAEMILSGHARAYDGGKRAGWCGDTPTHPSSR